MINGNRIAQATSHPATVTVSAFTTDSVGGEDNPFRFMVNILTGREMKFTCGNGHSRPGREDSPSLTAIGLFMLVI